ncbi:MAG: cupredoxin domain-containing protein [Alicyclobacillus sp.]|nr:cupredoxin domain-containing protein [Alicyclobacillus sp.]
MQTAWMGALALMAASFWHPAGPDTALRPGSHPVVPAAVLAPRRVVTAHIAITDQGFRPNRILAVINQPVHIVVVNKGRKVHQFSIPYFRIFTENLKPGQSSDVRFSPWEPGRFDMISDPSGQNRPEFRGDFIVTDAK